MKFILRYLFTFFLCLIFSLSFTQEFTTQLKLKKTFSDTDKWVFNSTGHWKKIYHNDDWNRIGLDVSSTRKLGIWSLGGGVVTNYTFDNAIENNTELRPWAGISLQNVIYKQLKLDQSIKYELRNFFFSGDTPNQTISRTTYDLEPSYRLKKDWEIQSGYTWYFLSNDDIPVRFLGSREWNVGMKKEFEDVSITLAYTREKFTAIENADDQANSLILLIAF